MSDTAVETREQYVAAAWTKDAQLPIDDGVEHIDVLIVGTGVGETISEALVALSDDLPPNVIWEVGDEIQVRIARQQ